MVDPAGSVFACVALDWMAANGQYLELTYARLSVEPWRCIWQRQGVQFGGRGASVASALLDTLRDGHQLAHCIADTGVTAPGEGTP